MKKTTKVGIIVSLYLIFAFAFFTFVHEFTHQRVYSVFGVNSTIGFEYPNFVTIANETEIQAMTDSDRNTMNFLQVQTEIFGYHIFTVFSALIWISVILLLSKTKNNI